MNNIKIDSYEFIINKHKGLVYHIVNRFNVCAFDRDDLIQVGLMALLQAAKRFDINKGIKFSTYAVPFILWSIKKELRNKVCYLNEEEIDNLKSPTDNFKYQYLNEEELELYKLRVIKQLSQREIANKLGVDQSTISRKLKKLKVEIKKGM